MKKYNILVIDDEEDVKGIFEVLKNEIEIDGYDVTFDFIHDLKEEDFNINKPYDVLMFDCYAPASNLMKLRDKEKGEKIGFSLIKKFREKNRRTKIIFYSSSFNIDTGEVPFTSKEFVHIINELNIFKIIERNNIQMMFSTIKGAIEELDAILISMEDIQREYITEEIYYETGEKNISLNELIEQFKLGGADAERFRRSVIEQILHYILKFKFR